MVVPALVTAIIVKVLMAALVEFGAAHLLVHWFTHRLPVDRADVIQLGLQILHVRVGGHIWPTEISVGVLARPCLELQCGEVSRVVGAGWRRVGWGCFATSKDSIGPGRTRAVVV